MLCMKNVNKGKVGVIISISSMVGSYRKSGFGVTLSRQRRRESDS